MKNIWECPQYLIDCRRVCFFPRRDLQQHNLAMPSTTNCSARILTRPFTLRGTTANKHGAWLFG